MSKLVWGIILMVFSVNMSIVNVDAAIIDAANCEKTSVDSAIASASSGDVVVIPSGTCSWSSAVVIPSGKSITIKGQTTTSRNATTYEVTATDGTTIQSTTSALMSMNQMMSELPE